MPQTDRGQVIRLRREGDSPDSRALSHLLEQLFRACTLEEIMEIVTAAVRTFLQADGATFVLRDGDRCYYAEEDAVSPLWKGRRFPMSACISGWCMRNSQPAAVPDIYQDPRIPADVYRPTFVRSLAMAPVGVEEPIGALGAYWSGVRAILPEEIETLRTIANAAAPAIAGLQARQSAASPEDLAPRADPRPKVDPRQSFMAFARRLGRGGLRKDSAEAYAVAVLLVIVATLVRMGVGHLGVRGLAIFSTYYPAVLLAILIGGTRAGLLAALLGGLAAYWNFMPPLNQVAAVTVADGLNLAIYFGASGLMIAMVDRYQRAVGRLTLEDAKHLMLAREQQHRLKNAIYVVETIVRQSLRTDPALAGVISRRIRAGLTDVDVSLSASPPVGVGTLLTEELKPFDLNRFTFDGGDEAPLAPEGRGILVLAAHELATNALKYGALSVPEGRVAVRWRTGPDGVTVTWQEMGGPRIQPPEKRGYGSVLLRRLAEVNGGSMTTDFRPTGLVATVSLPWRPRRRG